MNTDDEQPARDIEEFRNQFVRAIGRQPSRRKVLRLRAVAALAGVLAVGGSAVAVAQVIKIPLPDDIPVLTETNTIGYIDLRTNELIRCPDGEPLTRTHETEPKCDDGSVPEVFQKQMAAFEKWARDDAKFGQPVSDGPDFAVELDE